ncbi:MAG: hypothetical protein KKD53_08485, partial [Proteobacteria bacterium]|nr:hypothetical protein [Pseudomonadota bacterium]
GGLYSELLLYKSQGTQENPTIPTGGIHLWFRLNDCWCLRLVVQWTAGGTLIEKNERGLEVN